MRDNLQNDKKSIDEPAGCRASAACQKCRLNFLCCVKLFRRCGGVKKDLYFPQKIPNINKRYGENGEADHSMPTRMILYRIEYALDNYDDVKLVKNVKGSDMRRNRYRNADGNITDMVTYYIIELVPVAKARTLFIHSAYMNKRGTKKKKHCAGQVPKPP